MKLLLTGDLHVGSGLSYIPNSIDRTFEAINNIYKLAIERGITTVIVSGDCFDSVNVTAEVKARFADLLLAYDEVGICSLVIPGNHDSYMDGKSNLDYLALLTDHGRFKHSVVVEKTRLVIREGYGFLLFAGEKWDTLEGHINAFYNGSIQLGLKELIVVAHATVKGAITSTGFALEHGIEYKENQALLTLLGDLHVKQEVAPRTWYAGSPLQINFGEGGEHGVLIFDTENSSKPEFVPIDSIKLISISDPEQHIPERTLARIVYDKKPLTDVVLADNVIATKWFPSEVDLSSINVDDSSLLAGLDDIMTKRGLSKDELTLAHDELKKSLIAIGS